MSVACEEISSVLIKNISQQLINCRLLQWVGAMYTSAGWDFEKDRWAQMKWYTTPKKREREYVK